MVQGTPPRPSFRYVRVFPNSFNILGSSKPARYDVHSDLVLSFLVSDMKFIQIGPYRAFLLRNMTESFPVQKVMS